MKRFMFLSVCLVAANTSASQEGCEKLYKAAELGDFETVVTITREKPVLAACSGKWGYTPLHGVVTGHGPLTKADIEIIKHLILNGADVEAKAVGGVTPLHITPYPEVVELLVENGASLETTDNSGGTGIHFYAESSNGTSALKKALQLGAGVNHRDKSGRTALDIATSRNELGKIELLKEYGAE